MANGEFRIEDDRQAEWALEKIRQARQELEKWEAFYTGKLEAVRQETQGTIEHMSGLLRQYFETQEHRVTKTGIEKYSLPSGELILKPAAMDYRRNEAELLDWCTAHRPEAVKVTRKVGWAEVKAHIRETGEVPDGVEVCVTEPEFQIREGK